MRVAKRFFTRLTFASRLPWFPAAAAIIVPLAWINVGAGEWIEADAEAIALATHAWNRYLETGRLSPGQVKAAAAANAAEFLEFLRAE